MNPLMRAVNERRIAEHDGFDHPEFGSRMHQVKLDELPPGMFWQQVRDGFIMLRPGVHREWSMHTGVLKTAVLDHHGYVHSVGFPPGQGPDGPVVVADCWLGRGLRLREQHEHSLGALEEVVTNYVLDECVGLVEFMEDPTERAFACQHSFLFAWDGALHLLRYVDKGTLLAREDPFTLRRLADRFDCQVWAPSAARS